MNKLNFMKTSIELWKLISEEEKYEDSLMKKWLIDLNIWRRKLLFNQQFYFFI